MMHALRVTSASVGIGWSSFKALYSLRSWLTTWLLRVLLQVTFFASLGLIISDRSMTTFLLIGNAVAILSLECAVMVLSVSAEKWQGTLPGLASAPSSMIVVLWSRSLHYILTGIISSLSCLLLLSLLFGVQISPLGVVKVLPLFLLIGLSCYSYAFFLSSLSLRWPQMTWLALNLGYLLITVIGGINVPVSFWPPWVQAISSALPVSHGLLAVRGILAGQGYPEVMGYVGQELLVLLAWSVLAFAAYSLLVWSVRRGYREVF